jgi:hypothetical protein
MDATGKPDNPVKSSTINDMASLKSSKKISTYVYQIELPPSMKYHNVIYISLLEPTTNDAYPRQNIEPPPLVEIDSEDEYFLEAILNS